MGRLPDVRVTRVLAREICERQGLKAMLVGSITPLGRSAVALDPQFAIGYGVLAVTCRKAGETKAARDCHHRPG